MAPVVLPAYSRLQWSLSLGFPGLSVLGPHMAGFIPLRGGFCLERSGMGLCPGH